MDKLQMDKLLETQETPVNMKQQLDNINNIKNPNHTNNIDNMLNHIVQEKDKLEKLTKTVFQNKNTKTSNHTKKHNTHNANTTHTTKNGTIIKHMQLDIDGDDELDNKIFKNLGLKEHISPETEQKILEILKNYVKMDKSFRVKHESLKTLYGAYLDLYKKYKESNQDISKVITTNNNIHETQETQEIQPVQEHKEILKQIHTEMKDNNSNLYKQRLLILKKIKETPDIQPEIKNKICGRLLIIFKSPPVSNYTQLPMLEQGNTKNYNNSKYAEEKIDVKELDDAYLQKHNELMTVYKAYQNLYNVVLNYKDQLDKYKNLPTGSSISRCHMDKLIKDQSFVMDMIDKMQDQLVSKNIISNSEKVPVSPVTSHPENIGTFNNTMRDQIRQIIDRQVEIKPSMKTRIEDLLGKYKDCDSNDQFCQSGRQLLLLKKM